jgi:hypothetical protein
MKSKGDKSVRVQNYGSKEQDISYRLSLAKCLPIPGVLYEQMRPQLILRLLQMQHA